MADVEPSLVAHARDARPGLYQIAWSYAEDPSAGPARRGVTPNQMVAPTLRMVERMSAGEGARPLVSVLMTVFNHAPFVERAIRSVLQQETLFAFELVVGDDRSTDASRDVVAALNREFEGRIVSVLSTVNVGEVRNIAQTLAVCRGQYIALIDGDDYWTDPNKLQRQVDYLKARTECSLCFHDVVMIDSHGGEKPWVAQKIFSSLEDILQSNFIATSSVMFRRSALPDLPPWYFDMQWGDWPLYVLLAQRGLLGRIASPMGVYRIHAGGAWSGLAVSQRSLQIVDFYSKVKPHLAAPRQKQVLQAISERWMSLSAVYEGTGDRTRARYYARQGVWMAWRAGGVRAASLRQMLRLHVPADGVRTALFGRA